VTGDAGNTQGLDVANIQYLVYGIISFLAVQSMANIYFFVYFVKPQRSAKITHDASAANLTPVAP
jgi:hypothetical protein